LFGRLERWRPLIIAADRNLLTRTATATSEPMLRLVRTTGYASNGIGRVVNWLSYAAAATVAGIRGPRPTVVYASSPHLFAGLAGWLVATARRSSFVLEVRDLWPAVLVEMGALTERSPLFRVMGGVERFLYRRADALVVLTEGVRDALVASGVPIDKLSVIPNGAEPSDFAVDADRDELRRRFGFGGFVLLYAGAHGPANGLDLVLDAAVELADLPDVRFVLVGDGLTKPTLQAEARRRNLANVTFLDPVAKERMPELLAAADIGLHVLADVPLFRYGVSPNKLYDYMAAGLPVLTNTPGEVAGLVNWADAGLAVAPDALADGVRAMVQAGPEVRQAWSSAGRQFMNEHRSRRMLAARLEALLDEVAGP
jgi:glycosyltransferase involved in cell wall biosynthesis